MSSSTTGLRRGAPEQHPVDVLRTKLWMGVVKLRSNLRSGYAVELAVNPELVKKRSAGVVRPRKWDGYETGTRVPKPIKGKRYAVDEAEALSPGAKPYFVSKLWDVLKGKPFLPREVDDQLLRLDSAVVDLLLEDLLREGESTRRFRAFDLNVVDKLIELGSFDCLVAAILLVAKSDSIGSAELRDLALRCYFGLQKPVAKLPEIEPWAVELFRLIDMTCKHWVFPHPNARMDITIYTERLAKLPPFPGSDSS